MTPSKHAACLPESFATQPAFGPSGKGHATHAPPSPVFPAFPAGNQRAAVVLLSGGLDSATVLYLVRQAGYRPHTLSFRYGQRHEHELISAEALSKAAGAIEHRVLRMDLGSLGGSALTDDIPVPKAQKRSDLPAGIPVTYVPARNTVFLAVALGYAEVLKASDIFLGINALDYSGYPDCRPAFLDAFQNLANLATRVGVEGQQPIRIHAPLLYLSKAEIIATGLALGVDYSVTRTCYDPDATGAACGLCDACHLRLQAFAQNGLSDPAPYRQPPRVNEQP